MAYLSPGVYVEEVPSAIKPIAVRMVHEAYRAVRIPVIGLGGILTPEDAVEFMLAGATAVEVGTASYADPRATERLAKGLASAEASLKKTREQLDSEKDKAAAAQRQLSALGRDVDARAFGFLVQRLAQRQHISLGGIIDRRVRPRLKGGGRGDVEDGAAS